MAHAPLMETLAKLYVGACEQTGIEPDVELLGPVGEVFQRLNT